MKLFQLINKELPKKPQRSRKPTFEERTRFTAVPSDFPKKGPTGWKLLNLAPGIPIHTWTVQTPEERRKGPTHYGLLGMKQLRDVVVTLKIAKWRLGGGGKSRVPRPDLPIDWTGYCNVFHLGPRGLCCDAATHLGWALGNLGIIARNN